MDLCHAIAQAQAIAVGRVLQQHEPGALQYGGKYFELCHSWAGSGPRSASCCTEALPPSRHLDSRLLAHLQGREDAAEHEVVQLARQALLLTAQVHITRCYLPDTFNQAQARTLHSMPQK
jgi:hypothetical protein